MRVTNSMMLRSTMRDVGQSLSRLQDTQTKITSGKAITRGSDDPTGTASAMSIRQDLRRLDQRSRSVDDAQGWAGAADTQLTGMMNRLNRAKELVIAAGNGVTNLTPMARQAIAAELRSVRSDLLNAGNATYAGRSLFAGTAAGPAYDSNGAYLGNDDAVVRDVTATTSMTVNVTGSEVFGVSGTGAGSLFDVLDRMATAISNGDSTTIATEHTNLETATDRVRSAAASIGTKSAALVDLRSRIDDDIASLTSRLSEVEDVDIVESLVRAKAEENSYQAAVQAAAKIIPVSLLDYLR